VGIPLILLGSALVPNSLTPKNVKRTMGKRDFGI
jgi:hypothetical protein